jgi:hypothetical protein
VRHWAPATVEIVGSLSDHSRPYGFTDKLAGAKIDAPTDDAWLVAGKSERLTSCAAARLTGSVSWAFVAPPLGVRTKRRRPPTTKPANAWPDFETARPFEAHSPGGIG